MSLDSPNANRLLSQSPEDKLVWSQPPEGQPEVQRPRFDICILNPESKATPSPNLDLALILSTDKFKSTSFGPFCVHSYLLALVGLGLQSMEPCRHSQ